jgi:DNA-binding transcriptional LysR family regulator
MGLGVALLPRPVVEGSNYASKLWPLLEDREAPTCTIYLMSSTGRTLSEPAQLFHEMAKALLGCEEEALV